MIFVRERMYLKFTYPFLYYRNFVRIEPLGPKAELDLKDAVIGLTS